MSNEERTIGLLERYEEIVHLFSEVISVRQFCKTEMGPHRSI